MEYQQSAFTSNLDDVTAPSASFERWFCGSIEGWGPLSRIRFGLTPCFEYSVLLGTLSTLTIVSLISRYVALRKWSSPHGLGRTGWIYWPSQICMASTGVTALGVLVHLAHQDKGTTPAAVFGYTALAAAWVLAAPLNYYEHVYSIRSSDMIFTFYILSLSALLIQIRTLYLLSNNSESSFVQLNATLFMISTLLSGFIVEAWPRGSTKVQRSSSAPIYDKANLFSQMTYFFFLPIVRLGNTKSLSIRDIDNQLPGHLYTSKAYSRLDSYWTANMEIARIKGKEPSLFWAVLRSQLFYVPALLLVRISRVFTNFAIPVILSLLLAYFQDLQDLQEKFSVIPADSITKIDNSGPEGDSGNGGKTSLTYGLFLVIAMFVMGLANSVLLTVSRQYCIVCGLEIRSALLSMVYRKTLRLSPGARQVSTLGSITSHMSVDADYWLEAGIHLTTWVAVPLEIFLGLLLLYRLLGWSAWVGFLTMLTISPLQIWRARVFGKLQRKKNGFIDERIRLTTEVLSAIKIVKLYAWEEAFLKRILDVRNMELGVLRHIGALYAVMSIVFNSLTLIISLVTLSIYATWGGPGFTPGTLTPQIVFVSMTLFALLKAPIASLTETTTATVTLTVGTSRIQAFLLQEENDPGSVAREDVSDNSPEGLSVVLEDATFSWNRELLENQDDADETHGLLQGSYDGESTESLRPTLQHINLSVKSGSLVAIVGRVGQGKSSLLSALIGEMYKFHGYAKTVGRIAYVPQQSWILNATLRDNILFGLEYDQERYERVIAASGLEPDLAILPAGDQTEIGERGINLSGGQKQRVSLARAAYNDADIYLLDDPLSAVDAHVDQHLWSKLLGPQGLLRNKTRLLVTHGINHLQEVDHIILLKDGCIAETGHFEDLMAAGQTFCQLISEYAVTHRYQDDFGTPSGVESESEETQSQATVEVGTSGDTAAATTTSTKGVPIGATDTNRSIKKDKKAGIIQAENILDGGLTASIFLGYLRAITYKYALLIMLFQVLMQVCYVGTSLWLKYWIEQNEDTDQDSRPSLSIFLLVFSGLTLVYVLIGIALFWVAFGVARIRASEYLHRIFMSRIMRLPPAFFDTTPLGRIINRVSSDFASIDDRIPWKLFEAIGHAVSLVASLTVVAFTTPLFLVASPFIALIYYYVQKYYLQASQAVKRICRATQSPIYQHFQETLTGVPTIRAMNLQDRFITASAKRSDLYSNSFIAMAYCIRWMEILVQMVNVVVTLLACLWFVLLPQGSVNAATAGLALCFAMSNSQSLIWFARTYSDLYVHMIAVERVQEYTELKTEAPPLTAPDSEAGRALEHRWPQDGKIEFADYSTRYREGMDLVLKSISFTVEGGKKVGIVGRTGAGKSSLTLALFRMIEAANSEWAKATSNSSNQEPEDHGNEENQLDGGKIVIDNIGISNFGLADLRKNLSIIPQDPVLFAGTVRENLDPFEELEDVVLWEALERSYLQDVIAALPGGLLFQVAQNGENFSVGQRSLICLARALLRKSKILVLDEATSAVDIETDELIQKTIRTAFKERTILTIAHRLKTVMDSDKIIVLDHGRVVEYDAPKVLLQDEGSLFYKLAKQAGEV